MLTVDATSNTYQIWTASLMRWARKAPSPSDEGQAQRRQQGWTYSVCICLLQCRSAWMKRKYRPNGSTISMSAILADSIPMAGRILSCFPICCQQLMLSASHRAPPRLWPTWTVTAQSMLNDGANHPKYGWKMENMSQTTNQVTIAAFFRPTRIDKKKNAPAIQRVVSHLKNEIRL